MIFTFNVKLMKIRNATPIFQEKINYFVIAKSVQFSCFEKLFFYFKGNCLVLKMFCTYNIALLENKNTSHIF